MNCTIFAKMDQVFSLETFKKYWKMEKILEKSGNFFQFRKVGTTIMQTLLYFTLFNETLNLTNSVFLNMIGLSYNFYQG